MFRPPWLLLLLLLLVACGVSSDSGVGVAPARPARIPPMGGPAAAPDATLPVAQLSTVTPSSEAERASPVSETPPSVEPIVLGDGFTILELPSPAYVSGTEAQLLDDAGGPVCTLPGGVEVTVLEAAKDRATVRVAAAVCEGWVEVGKLSKELQ